MSSGQTMAEDVVKRPLEGSIERLVERLDDLEAQVAFQDDLIASLNDQVTRQELDLHRLWEAKKLMKKQLADLSPSNIRNAEDETAPPHY